MRRLAAALVLMGALSLSVMVPGASAQWGPVGPWGAPPQGQFLQSFGTTGGVPYASTQFFGPGAIQCQYGGYLQPPGLLGGLGNGASQQAPFFNASVYGPFGPGPCTPPPGLLGGGFGLGGGLGFGGLNSAVTGCPPGSTGVNLGAFTVCRF
jgi:hypothetical protein